MRLFVAECGNDMDSATFVGCPDSSYYTCHILVFRMRFNFTNMGLDTDGCFSISLFGMHLCLKTP